MSRIEVIRADGPLREEAWLFWFNDRDCCLYLDWYGLSQRPSTRHKMKLAAFYRRIDQRSNTIDEEDVPLPQGVMDEAKAKFVATITVRKWCDDL